MADIAFVLHDSIDQQKWDHCVKNAGNSRIYACYEYLEQMARGNWDALILADYELVMPLPWRKKYGIYYVYQPAFTAAAGVFGNGIDASTVKAFMNAIPPRFRLVEIPLNAGNPIEMENIFQRQNFVLPLAKDYPDLYSGFRESTKRNIRKAAAAGCRLAETISIDQVISLNRAFMNSVSKPDEQDYVQFQKLYEFLAAEDQALILGVEDARNELLAAAVFFFDRHRAYYILVGNTANGKTLGASHFLINGFIEKYAGTDLLLDFEGSDIRSLAFFYSSFGAEREVYPALRINRLPRLLRWLK